MSRSCSNCGDGLNDQPALEGINGWLCFPCRFRFDESGGQEFVLKAKEYQSASARWESVYRRQWNQFLERQRCADNFELVCGVATISSFLSWLVFKSIGLAAILAVGAAASWLASRIAIFAAERLWCEPPPSSPVPDQHAMSAKPQLLFDTSHARVGEPAWDTFNGYPPDWPKRQEFVLKRDRHQCRLCTRTTNLHVHHVWPVSFSSRHTPQNLITLCRACHMKQDYWEHKTLVCENIKAKRKYSVAPYTRADGTAVKGHKRKVGRRGKFWKRVRGERRSSRSTDTKP